MDIQPLHRQNLDHHLLTIEAERDLLERSRQGDRAAIDDLVRSNQRLVMHIAMRYRRSGAYSNHDLMDLVQYGNLGLLEAIKRFDPRHQVRFSTYACWWIRAIIRRGVLTQGAPMMNRTAREGDLVVMVRKAIDHGFVLYGRRPTEEEISRISRLSPNIVRRVLSMLGSPAISLYTESCGDLTIEDLLPSTEDTAGEAEANLRLQELAAIVQKLPPRYAYVISMHYGLMDGTTLSFQEIAERLGVTRQRVQQIEVDALRLLRKIVPHDS